MVRILVSAANSFDSFIPAFCHSSEYPFALYVATARSIAFSGSAISSNLSAPTYASNVLNGSAFGEGID